ncbi:MAG: hotdog domain-containing protein, partial [Sphingopyxis sp.]
MAELLAIPAHAFTLRFVAEPETIDELGHVNNAVWVQWIQSVATAHWTAKASAAEQAAFIWVVVRHEIDCHRPLLVGQGVTAHSW